MSSTTTTDNNNTTTITTATDVETIKKAIDEVHQEFNLARLAKLDTEDDVRSQVNQVCNSFDDKMKRLRKILTAKYQRRCADKLKQGATVYNCTISTSEVETLIHFEVNKHLETYYMQHILELKNLGEAYAEAYDTMLERCFRKAHLKYGEADTDCDECAQGELNGELTMDLFD